MDKKERDECNKIFDNGLRLFVAKDYKKSIKEFRKLLKKVKNDPLAYHYIALCHGKMNHFFRAHHYFDKSLKYEERAITYFNKGITIYFSNVKNNVKKWEEALKNVQQAILMEDDNPHFWYYRGVLLTKLKRIEEAKDCFFRCLKFDKKFRNKEKNKVFSDLKGKKKVKSQKKVLKKRKGKSRNKGKKQEGRRKSKKRIKRKKKTVNRKK